MTSICACGAVSVTIDTKPEFINDCNCSLCRKTGGAWGYFPSAAVKTAGRTVPFVRADKAAPAVEIHSCETCAVTTHFVLTTSFKEQNPAVDQAGVNMRLFDPDDLKGVEVRYPNGKDWTGSGPFGYRRDALTISETSRW